MDEVWLVLHNFDPTNWEVTMSLSDRWRWPVNQVFHLKRDGLVVHLGVRGVRIDTRRAQQIAMDFVAGRFNGWDININFAQTVRAQQSEDVPD